MGFSMECHGRRLTGTVTEREEAFRQYDDALVAGHGAALLEQERPTRAHGAEWRAPEHRSQEA
jgi:Ca-activated chloride channel family protein